MKLLLSTFLELNIFRIGKNFSILQNKKPNAVTMTSGKIMPLRKQGQNKICLKVIHIYQQL
jgi:hypothetical protein